MTKKKRGPRKGSFHPSPYNWTVLETEYLGGEIDSVAEFFRIKNISPNTHKEHTQGWGEKRRLLQDQAKQKALQKLAKDQERILKTHIQLGDGLFKKGVDALSAVDKDGKAVLNIESVREAAQVISAGASIQRNALVVEKADELAKLAPEQQVVVTIDESERRHIRIIMKDPKLRKAAALLLDNMGEGDEDG